MNKSRSIRGLPKKQLESEESEDSNESIELQQKVQKLLNLENEFKRPRFFGVPSTVDMPKLRRSIVTRAFQNFASSTPSIKSQRGEFFSSTQSSVNFSPIIRDASGCNNEHVTVSEGNSSEGEVQKYVESDKENVSKALSSRQESKFINGTKLTTNSQVKAKNSFIIDQNCSRSESNKHDCVSKHNITVSSIKQNVDCLQGTIIDSFRQQNTLDNKSKNDEKILDSSTWKRKSNNLDLIKNKSNSVYLSKTSQNNDTNNSESDSSEINDLRDKAKSVKKKRYMTRKQKSICKVTREPTNKRNQQRQIEINDKSDDEEDMKSDSKKKGSISNRKDLSGVKVGKETRNSNDVRNCQDIPYDSDNIYADVEYAPKINDSAKRNCSLSKTIHTSNNSHRRNVGDIDKTFELFESKLEEDIHHHVNHLITQKNSVPSFIEIDNTDRCFAANFRQSRKSKSNNNNTKSSNNSTNKLKKLSVNSIAENLNLRQTIKQSCNVENELKTPTLTSNSKTLVNKEIQTTMNEPLKTPQKSKVNLKETSNICAAKGKEDEDRHNPNTANSSSSRILSDIEDFTQKRIPSLLFKSLEPDHRLTFSEEDTFENSTTNMEYPWRISDDVVPNIVSPTYHKRLSVKLNFIKPASEIEKNKSKLSMSKRFSNVRTSQHSSRKLEGRKHFRQYSNKGIRNTMDLSSDDNDRIEHQDEMDNSKDISNKFIDELSDDVSDNSDSSVFNLDNTKHDLPRESIQKIGNNIISNAAIDLSGTEYDSLDETPREHEQDSQQNYVSNQKKGNIKTSKKSDQEMKNSYKTRGKEKSRTLQCSVKTLTPKDTTQGNTSHSIRKIQNDNRSKQSVNLENRENNYIGTSFCRTPVTYQNNGFRTYQNPHRSHSKAKVNRDISDDDDIDSKSQYKNKNQSKQENNRNKQSVIASPLHKNCISQTEQICTTSHNEHSQSESAAELKLHKPTSANHKINSYIQSKNDDKTPSSQSRQISATIYNQNSQCETTPSVVEVNDKRDLYRQNNEKSKHEKSTNIQRNSFRGSPLQKTKCNQNSQSVAEVEANKESKNKDASDLEADNENSDNSDEEVIKDKPIKKSELTQVDQSKKIDAFNQSQNLTQGFIFKEILNMELESAAKEKIINLLLSCRNNGLTESNSRNNTNVHDIIDVQDHDDNINTHNENNGIVNITCEPSLGFLTDNINTHRSSTEKDINKSQSDKNTSVNNYKNVQCNSSLRQLKSNRDEHFVHQAAIRIDESSMADNIHGNSILQQQQFLEEESQIVIPSEHSNKSSSKSFKTFSNSCQNVKLRTSKLNVTEKSVCFKDRSSIEIGAENRNTIASSSKTNESVTLDCRNKTLAPEISETPKNGKKVNIISNKIFKAQMADIDRLEFCTTSKKTPELRMKRKSTLKNYSEPTIPEHSFKTVATTAREKRVSEVPLQADVTNKDAENELGLPEIDEIIFDSIHEALICTDPSKIKSARKSIDKLFSNRSSNKNNSLSKSRSRNVINADFETEGTDHNEVEADAVIQHNIDENSKNHNYEEIEIDDTLATARTSSRKSGNRSTKKHSSSKEKVTDTSLSGYYTKEENNRSRDDPDHTVPTTSKNILNKPQKSKNKVKSPAKTADDIVFKVPKSKKNSKRKNDTEDTGVTNYRRSKRERRPVTTKYSVGYFIFETERDLKKYSTMRLYETSPKPLKKSTACSSKSNKTSKIKSNLQLKVNLNRISADELEGRNNLKRHNVNSEDESTDTHLEKSPKAKRKHKPLARQLTFSSNSTSSREIESQENVNLETDIPKTFDMPLTENNLDNQLCNTDFEPLMQNNVEHLHNIQDMFTSNSQEVSKRDKYHRSVKSPGKIEKPKKKNKKISPSVSKVVSKGKTNTSKIETTNPLLRSKIQENETIRLLMNDEIVSIKCVDNNTSFEYSLKDGILATSFVENETGSQMRTLKILPGSKMSTNSSKYSLMFFVFSGEGCVLLNNITNRIGVMSRIVVPAGVQYSITNSSPQEPLIMCCLKQCFSTSSYTLKGV